MYRKSSGECTRGGNYHWQPPSAVRRVKLDAKRRRRLADREKSHICATEGFVDRSEKILVATHKRQVVIVGDI